MATTRIVDSTLSIYKKTIDSPIKIIALSNPFDNKVIAQTSAGLSLYSLTTAPQFITMIAPADFNSENIKNIFYINKNKIILIYSKPGEVLFQLIPACLSEESGNITCTLSVNTVKLWSQYRQAQLSLDQRFILIDIPGHINFRHTLFSTDSLTEFKAYGDNLKLFLSPTLIGELLPSSETYSRFSDHIDVWRTYATSSTMKDQVGTLYPPRFFNYVVAASVSPDGKWIAWLSIKRFHPELWLQIYSLKSRTFNSTEIEPIMEIEVKYTLKPGNLVWLNLDTIVFININEFLQSANPITKEIKTLHPEKISEFCVINNSILSVCNGSLKVFDYHACSPIQEIIINELLKSPALYTVPTVLLTLIAEYAGHYSTAEPIIERISRINESHYCPLDYPAPKMSLTDNVHHAARQIPVIGWFASGLSKSEKLQKLQKEFPAKLIAALENKADTQSYTDCISTTLSTHAISREDCPYHIQNLMDEFIKMDPRTNVSLS